MKSLIYIDLTENNNYSFEKKIITELKLIDSTLTCFDIDYQSDSSLLENAKRLMKDSSQSIIVIESSSEHSSKVSPFAELFVEEADKYLIFLDGENQWIERLCAGIDKNYLKKNLSFEEKLSQVKKFIEK